MKMKKMLAFLLIGVMAIGATVSTKASVLYKKSEEQTLTKGAKFIKDEVLTEAGWLDIYLLRVDLNEENVALKPIEPGTLGTKQTVLQMAKESGAIAGVNADFFGLTSNVPSFGPVIEDGEIKHAYHNGLVTDVGPGINMGTFLIDNQNNLLMNYFSMGLKLYANGEWLSSIRAYNKTGTSLSTPTIIDAQYAKSTLDIVRKFTGAYTIVVDQDVVVHQSGIGEAFDIPENGYVIMMDGANKEKYYPYLKVGTPVTLESDFYLNNEVVKSVEDIKLGIGGGGLLMQNGEAYKGKSNIVSPASRNPRTVVATTKKSGEVLLIGIDGRGTSIGVTHEELVSLLKTYGVVNALYLDGGGSTTVVARDETATEVKLQNKPSDSSERKVVNGIGIFTTNATGELDQLYIESSNNRTFVDESISFTVRGLDSNSNPVTIDKNQLSYSISGIEGSFVGNQFTPSTAGKGLVMVQLGDTQAAVEIKVSEEPVGLILEPTKLQVDANSSKTIKIYGVDPEGYKLPLSASKVHWETNNEAVQAEGNVITATNESIGLLRAEYKKATAEIEVIGGSSVILAESFEQNNGKWGGDTTTVSGKVELSKDVKYHGSQSVKMTYHFGKTTNRQTAFMTLNSPIVVPTDAATINLWLNADAQKDAVKLQVEDSKGRKYYLKVSDSLTHKGWKYFSIPLPQGMQLPAKITRVYALTATTPEKRTSALYVDHLSFTRGQRKTQGISIKDHYRYDPLYRDDLSGLGEGEQAINVIGPTKINSLTLEAATIKSIGQTLSKDTNMVVQASNATIELPITKTLYNYRNKLETMDINNTKVMMVGSDSGSIRTTDVAAWAKMTKQINETTVKNIILVTKVNPLTQFNDAREGQALHDVLKAKNKKDGTIIFVIVTGGNENETTLQDGIRYIRLNGFASTTDNINDAAYLRFKIVGDQIYYGFNQLIK